MTWSGLFRIGAKAPRAYSQGVPMKPGLTAKHPPLVCRLSPINLFKPCLSKTITW